MNGNKRKVERPALNVNRVYDDEKRPAIEAFINVIVREIELRRSGTFEHDDQVRYTDGDNKLYVASTEKEG